MKWVNPYASAFLAAAALSDSEKLVLRKALIWAYSWSVPSEEAVRGIAEAGPVVEIGSGTGYWAWCLSQFGARVDCFDREPHSAPRWLDSREGGPEALDLSPARTLLLSWPPLDEPMAAECLERFRGEFVAYVGEWRGRTADAAFHDRLERDFERVARWALPRWPGFLDEALLWRRVRS